jgi:hypothetical protein
MVCKPRHAALFLASLLAACNFAFGLEPTERLDVTDPAAAGAGGAEAEAGTGGRAGAAGAMGGQGGGAPVCDAPRAYSQTRRCDGDQQCKEATITPPQNDDEPFELECSGVQSCEKAIINCPSNAACRVICRGDQACKGARVRCGSGHCEVVCRNAGSTPTPNACEAMNDVDCNGATTCLVTCRDPMISAPGVSKCGTSGCSCQRDDCP